MCGYKVVAAVLGVASVMCYVAPARGQCQVNETGKLLASDGAAGDQFGGTVALSGDTAIIRAPGDEGSGPESGSVYVFHYDGSSWGEVAELLPCDGEAGDDFGTWVAIYGDTAVIGANADNDNGTRSGSAYIFEKGAGWTDGCMNQVAKLLASDGAPEDRFGGRVAVSGSAVLIGASRADGDSTDSGAAYVFVEPDEGWNPVVSPITETAKLTAFDGAAGDLFGAAMSISGDTALIGARWDNDNGSDSGSAYVFVEPTGGWASVPSPITDGTKLLASDGAAGDEFGASVAISGDSAVIGAYIDDDNGDNSGSAYVFRYDGSTWVQDPKLLPSDGGVGDVFGHSVAVSGNIAVIGAYQDDDNGNGAGAAYVFRYDGASWTEEAKLLASDGATGDRFGHGVAIDGGTALVGAYQDDDNGSNSGSAYVFSVECEPEDSDADGVPDDVDSCPNSDLGDSIVIDDCDTGVGNELFDDGCTMADRIAECVEGATTHGEFVSCVAQLANGWKQDGLISGREKGRIQSCVAQGNLQSQCQTDADCDDGLFCNGVEVCLGGACVVGDPCPGQSCDEATDECID